MNTYGTEDLVRRARIRRAAAVVCSWTLLVLVAALGAVAAWNWTAGMTLEEPEPLVTAGIIFNIALALAVIIAVWGFLIDVGTAGLRRDSAIAGLARYPGVLGIGYGGGLLAGALAHPAVTDARPETVNMAVIALIGGVVLFAFPVLIRWWRR